MFAPTNPVQFEHSLPLFTFYDLYSINYGFSATFYFIDSRHKMGKVVSFGD